MGVIELAAVASDCREENTEGKRSMTRTRACYQTRCLAPLLTKHINKKKANGACLVFNHLG